MAERAGERVVPALRNVNGSPRYRGIILSDLDGTFLDDAYRPAMSAREFARVRTQWRVIWVTSRTVDEVRWLQRLLGHQDDVIAENGGVCLTQSERVAAKLGNAQRDGDTFVVLLGDEARNTLTFVDDAFASVGRRARTFSDLTPAALAKRARYRVPDAVRAQHRAASVALVDTQIDDGATQIALAWLHSRGCTVSTGSRWTTVVRGTDKGRAAARWLRAIANELPVAAIGDGDNDQPLLEIADFPFVIRRVLGTHRSALMRTPNARFLQAPGTKGWREMIDILEHRIELSAPCNAGSQAPPITRGNT